MPRARFVVGEIEAPDRREVSRRLQQLGYVALDTGTGQGRRKRPRSFFSFQPPGRPARDHGLPARAIARAARRPDARRRPAAAGRRRAARACRYLRATCAPRSAAAQSFADALKRHPKLFGADLDRHGPRRRSLRQSRQSSGVGRRGAGPHRAAGRQDFVLAALSGGAVCRRRRRAGVLPGGRGAAIRHRAARFRPGGRRPCRRRARRLRLLCRTMATSWPAPARHLWSRLSARLPPSAAPQIRLAGS